MRYLYLFLLFTPFIYSQQGVGVGTNNPQQKLHIASPTGSLRVESLNHVNSTFNGGDVDGDSDFTNNSFPLYVDENGDFTLELVPLYNSEDSDALDNTVLPGASVTLLPTDADGKEETQITSYTIAINRATILEVKYNLSFDVYENAAKTVITERVARRISTYFRVSGSTRRYGPASKCYYSGSVNSVPGSMFNASTCYIILPAAGSYTISFFGEVSTNTKGSGGPPTGLANVQSTYVEFATGNDSIFFRLH